VLSIQYREAQRFSTHGFRAVGGLGSCTLIRTCPAPGRPAWERVLRSTGPRGRTYISSTQLRVEDGINAIVLTLINPDPPRPAPSEPELARRLVQLLLPRFRSN
jgi:hypothetical protein